MIFQSDGNLVIYSESGVPVWSTGTYDPNPGNVKNRMLAYQASDGNLVIYGNVPGRDGRYPLWAR